jgi:hypothetical protein
MKIFKGENYEIPALFTLTYLYLGFSNLYLDTIFVEHISNLFHRVEKPQELIPDCGNGLMRYMQARRASSMRRRKRR